MSKDKKDFITRNYESILNAISAVAEKYTCWGATDYTPIDIVTHCFFIPYLLYHAEYCKHCSIEATRFALEVVSYSGHKIVNEKELLLTNDLLLNEWIAEEILASKTKELHNLECLSGRISFVFACCIANDSQKGSDTYRHFRDTLQEYVSILIDTGQIQVSEEGLRFHRDFNKCMTSLNAYMPAISKGNKADLFAIFREESLGRFLSNNKNTNSLDVLFPVHPALSKNSSGNTTETDDLDQEMMLEQTLSEMNSLIGLQNIKSEVTDLLNLLKVQQMRKMSGLSSLEISKHMVFYGNPGTGKTTIARKLAEIYKVFGILFQGHFIETDRSSLVAGYLGQTAIKTKEVLELAKGGILFIDEAYSLCQGGDQDQYGQEAIDTLLKYMEDNRDDLVVIVAGYESKMSGFINSNPGLKSRFNKYFLFMDYDAPQLAAIFTKMAIQSQYVITPSFASSLDNLCQQMITRKTKNFGNGRTVRNLFERCISNQANRVVSICNPSQDELLQLLEGDLSIRDIEIVMQ